MTPDEATYTGSAIKPEVSGTFNAGTAEDPDIITLDDSEYTVSYENNIGVGSATASFEYKGKDAADSTYTSTVPSGIGEYTVKATIAGTSNYDGGEATFDMLKSKKDKSEKKQKRVC